MPIDLNDITEKFSDVRVFSHGARRVPNKPLLILFALGKLVSDKMKTLSFADCEEEYAELLRAFGANISGAPRPGYAFYRLKNDGNGAIWQVNDPLSVLTENSSGDVSVVGLRNSSVEAGFAFDVLEAFERDPSSIDMLAEQLLVAHFPISLHRDIRDFVGLSNYKPTATRRKRDPSFRAKILTSYEHQCAVCEFAVRLGTVPIGLEAAHIKWHQAAGPDEVNNGLALCSLHHKLFDLGAFTVAFDHRVVASELVNSAGKNAILDFHGKKIFVPDRSESRPSREFLNWHESQVFKGSPRVLP